MPPPLVRNFVHPDGRKWFGQVRGRSYQMVIDVPGDEPIVRASRAATREDAQARLDAFVAELVDSGFHEGSPAPWPLPELRAGAVLVVRTSDFNPSWIADAMTPDAARQARLPHGEGYKHRFIALPVSPTVTGVYYEITGYATREECAAFEDAFFTTQNVVWKLKVPSAPKAFLTLSDVGDAEDEFRVHAVDQSARALPDLDRALSDYGCTLLQLREGRARLSKGKVLWQIESPENLFSPGVDNGPRAPLRGGHMSSPRTQATALDGAPAPQPLPAHPGKTLDRALDVLAATQSEAGSWKSDYGGPMFLLPMYVGTAHAVGLPLDADTRQGMVSYLEHHQNDDGGFGLDVESHSHVMTSVLSYVALRLLGVSKDAPVTSRARAFFLRHGGAAASGSWGKFFLSVMGLHDYAGLHPLPPELWLLPKSLPFHPSRLWCHARMVYLPMSVLYGRRAVVARTPVLEALREELYTAPTRAWTGPRRSTPSPRPTRTPLTAR